MWNEESSFRVKFGMRVMWEVGRTVRIKKIGR